MTFDQILMQLIGNGPIGILAAVALWFAYQKNNELKDLYKLILCKEEKRAARDKAMFTELNETVRVLMAHSEEE